MGDITEDVIDIGKLTNIEILYNAMLNLSVEAVDLLKKEGIQVTGLNEYSFNLVRNKIIQDRTFLEIKQHKKDLIHDNDSFDFITALTNLRNIYKWAIPRDVDTKSFTIMVKGLQNKTDGK